MEDGRVDRATARGPAESPEAAEGKARDWAAQLGVDAGPLQAATVRQGKDVRATSDAEHLSVDVTLQAVRDGELAIAYPHVRFRP